MPNLVEPMLQNGTLPRVAYDAIIDSSVVQALKPEIRIYELAAEKAAVAPEEILLVDDDRTFLAAANSLGWHTMSFETYRPAESIAALKAALQPAA